MEGKVAYPVKRCYLTASAMISSLGFSMEENLEAVQEGRSGIRWIDNPALFHLPFRGAPIDWEKLGERIQKEELYGYSKLEQICILSLKETIRKSGFDPAKENCGLLIASTKGNINDLERKSGKPINGRGEFPPGSLPLLGRKIAEAVGMVHPPILISNACISGVSALVVASRLIRSGQYDHLLVVGGDILSRFIVTGFESFRSVSPDGCRPFDCRRNGLSLGEACGSLLLTSERRYVSEEQPVLLEGGAITNDANHISGPSRTGDGLYYAISQAMDETRLQPQDFSFVNPHGTGTPYNDEMESKALHWAGLDAIPLCGLKGYWGHTLGASGIIETLLCMESLREGRVYGTLGYTENGVPFPLNISPDNRPVEMKRCLKTASGFGGCNAAVVLCLESFARPFPSIPVSSQRKIREKQDCTIRKGEIRVGGEMKLKVEAEGGFAVFIRSAYQSLSLDDRKFYKMDDLCKLGYIGISYLLSKDDTLSKYKPDEIGLIFANASSSLDTDRRHQQILEGGGDPEASPAVFVYTLPNIVLGELCIRYQIKGENTFFISSSYDESFIRTYAASVMHSRGLKACFIGWCELLGEEYEGIFKWLEPID